jgi:hypothetical protein
LIVQDVNLPSVESTSPRKKKVQTATNQNGGHGATANLSATHSGLENETWVRLPGIGGRIEGLSRASVYRIIDDPKSGVVSVGLSQAGNKRGVRLIGLNSLRAYIARNAAEQLANRLAVREAA